jgi:L-alanine-DL-glutamate epimerase-like enolase superfamily enzyme
MKCTGMNEAYKMIGYARHLGLKVMIGCMSETSCAISAAASLASLCDHCDLDSPWMVSNNPFEALKIDAGKIVLKESPGLGIKII